MDPNLRNYYDAVAACGQPAKDDIDDLVDKLTGELSGASISRADLRRQVVDTTATIIRHREAGSFGAAREAGRAHAASVGHLVGSPPPERVTDIRAMVDSIPRWG